MYLLKGFDHKHWYWNSRERGKGKAGRKIVLLMEHLSVDRFEELADFISCLLSSSADFNNDKSAIKYSLETKSFELTVAQALQSVTCRFPKGWALVCRELQSHGDNY